MTQPRIVPPTSDRPWGSFAVLADAATGPAPIAVKILTVSPGRRLSLQTHELRSEEWTALDDGLRVQIGDDVLDLAAGDTVRVEVGTVHRIENVGAGPARIVEVMYGRYDEDDIVRLDYDRA